MLKLAPLFGNGCVLCRNKELRIFGQAEDGAAVTVTLNGVQAVCVAKDGRFLAQLPPQSAATGCTLTVACGEETITVTDVAIGEVYLAGGQSNMELELQNADEGQQLIPQHSDPDLRYFNVPKKSVWNGDAIQANAWSHWEKVVPGNARDMSAVAYFFARKLRERLNVPVGIIDCYWGGTSITAWMDEETLSATAEGRRYMDDYASQAGDKSLAQWQAEEDAFQAEMTEWNGKVAQLKKENPAIQWPEINEKAGVCPWHPPVGPGSPYRPAGLACTMVQRVVPATLTGIIFYQGEEDAARTRHYDLLMDSLIRCWRTWFREEELPFLFVQLPVWINNGETDPRDWPILRHAQELAWRRNRNTGMACIIDCGEYDNIHPTDKRTVGQRLFEQALRVVYGEAGACSPRAIAKHCEGSTLVVTLDAPVAVKGDGVPRYLEVAGVDGVYHEAKASIQGSTLRLACEAVPCPVSARYAHWNWCTVNLFGANGLPLAPFILP